MALPSLKKKLNCQAVCYGSLVTGCRDLKRTSATLAQKATNRGSRKVLRKGEMSQVKAPQPHTGAKLQTIRIDVLSTGGASGRTKERKPV